jgi:hypothetical protein
MIGAAIWPSTGRRVALTVASAYAIVRLHSLGRHREVWGVFLHQRERYQFLEPALVRTALAVQAILSDSGDLNGQIRGSRYDTVFNVERSQISRHAG